MSRLQGQASVTHERLSSPRALPRRRAAYYRRFAARLLFVFPMVAIVWGDLGRRPQMLAHLTHRAQLFYFLSVVLCAALWGALIVVSTRRRGAVRWLARGALVAGAVFALGAQVYTFERYQAYLNHRAVLVGTSMLPSVGQQLWSDRSTFAAAVLPPLVVALFLPLFGRALAATRPRRSRIALDLAVAALLMALFVSPARGEQDATPDMLYLSAMGQLARAHWDHNETVERVHPSARTPLVIPPLVAHAPAKRNVLFILTESVRAMSTCVGYEKECMFTPFSNAAAPHRIPLRQMRSVDSTTAISLSVMWSGLAPGESRAALHSAPLIWEYARAAHIDTAYWTSQNLLFGNSGAWMDGLPLTRFVSASQIEPDAELEIGADDGKLVDYAAGDLGALTEPFVGVLHLSNTHFPYKVDHAFAPFLPEEEATGPGYETEIRNRYQDAIYLQDRAIGRFLEALRARPEGARTVVVFLSDHGEQMREKGAVGHTGTLYEEEIRIPAWIDAPAQTLTTSEEASLRRLEDTPLTTLDVLPTILDLLGLWDAEGLRGFRAKMPGSSLLRGGSSTDGAVLLTNCSELWACAFKNWGAIRGTKKLIATQGDHAWNCYDLADDPAELHDLGPAACGNLASTAEAHARGRPF